MFHLKKLIYISLDSNFELLLFFKNGKNKPLKKSINNQFINFKLVKESKQNYCIKFFKNNWNKIKILGKESNNNIN